MNPSRSEHSVSALISGILHAGDSFLDKTENVKKAAD